MYESYFISRKKEKRKKGKKKKREVEGLHCIITFFLDSYIKKKNASVIKNIKVKKKRKLEISL